MEYLGIIFCFGIVVTVVVSLFWKFRRSGQMVQRWAEQNVFRLTESKNAPFVKGPFFWSTSRNQMVYRVVVEDAKGATRSGWVRCRSYWLGVWADKTEVRWDE